ncbi:uncharacterized protein LOC115426607 [Sphaeramia orbicularis]|uniref:uncharacterized protein LOC115426607 n=1 Tax=Sphaeramia orbicularis TaxID=375764 RepID=UPI00117DB30F|nr:uncharacterized protein LOC115426607 [Sphaeramia orbicularis]
MWFAEAVFLFVGVILHNSDVQGERNRICALKGSSLEMLCYSKPEPNPTCYTVHQSNDSYFQKEIPADSTRIKVNLTEGGNATLTINHVTDADENIYCCSENTEQCWKNGCELQVADVQVKVLPAEGPDEQAVTLMCTTSCDLTEKPTSYIWYKNGQFLYEDWSPWYQEVLSGDKDTTYSCSIKGHEAVRAPHVSVDSVSSACFTVSYAEGRMCSYKQMSVEKSCSITYPKNVVIIKELLEEKKDFFALNCNSSCPEADSYNVFKWFINRELFRHCENQYITIRKTDRVSYDTFTCAVKGHEDLHSDEFDGDAIKFSLRRVCALEGSSVTISSPGTSSYSVWKFKSWYEPETKPDRVKLQVEADYMEVSEYHTDLTVKHLMKNYSGEYMRTKREEERPDDFFPGMILIITGVKVTMFPSAVVTEGHRVTLTCTTSCPLTHTLTYIWFFNGLTLKENPNKHLVLDPVGLQHAGNYSCAVATPQNVSSSEEALTVQPQTKAVLILNAIKVILLLLIPPAVYLFCFYIRRKKTPTSATKPKNKVQIDQMEMLYESIPMTVQKPVAAARGKKAEQPMNKLEQRYESMPMTAQKPVTAARGKEAEQPKNKMELRYESIPMTAQKPVTAARGKEAEQPKNNYPDSQLPEEV